MKKSVRILFLVFLLSSVYSCQKTASNEELLIDKPWRLVDSKVEPEMRGTNNYLSLLGNCALDDIETYHANGEYTWDKGDSICEAEYDEERVMKGTWTLNEDMSQITILNEEDYPYIFTIESLNDSVMIISHTEEFEKTYKFTDTYKLK